MALGRTKNKYIKEVIEKRVREFGCIISGYTNEVIAHHINGGRSLDYDNLHIGDFTIFPLHRTFHQHSTYGIHDGAISTFENRHGGTEKQWCLKTHYRYIDVYGEPMCSQEVFIAIERYCLNKKSKSLYQEIL